MLQALIEDMSLSEWTMLLKGMAEILSQVWLSIWIITLLIPSFWTSASPWHMLLVRFSKPNYRGSISQVGCLFFFICCNFSFVSWWKVPILWARTALGGVTPWLEELCLFGVGVALGPPDGTNTQLFTLNLRCLQSSWSVGLPCMWRICEESMKNKRISKAIYICIWIYIYIRFRLLNSCE